MSVVNVCMKKKKNQIMIMMWFSMTKRINKSVVKEKRFGIIEIINEDKEASEKYFSLSVIGEII